MKKIWYVLLVALAFYLCWVWLPIGIIHGSNEAFYMVRTEYLSTGGSYSDWSFDNPPLFVYTLLGLSKVTGISLYAFRVFNIICTLFTAFIIYLIGKSMRDERTGLIASALFSFFPMIVIFSKIIQIDMFAILLSTLTFYLAYLGIKNNREIGDKLLVWSGIFLGLTLLAKIPDALVIIPIFFYFIQQKVSITKMFRIIGPSLLISLPWYGFFALTDWAWLTSNFKRAAPMSNYFGLVPGVRDATYQAIMIHIAYISIVLLVYLYFKYKPKAESKVLWLFSLVCVLFFLFLPNHEYYLLPLFVPLSIFLALEIKNPKPLIAVFLIASLIVIGVRPLYEINWEEPSKYIADNYPNANISSSANYVVLKYYLHKEIRSFSISDSNDIYVLTIYDVNQIKLLKENHVVIKEFQGKVQIWQKSPL